MEVQPAVGSPDVTATPESTAWPRRREDADGQPTTLLVMPADTPAKRVPSGAAVFREELTERILQVAVDELANRGWGRFSMEAVARISGVGKSALYRRWKSKEDLIVAAISEFSVPPAHFPDSGSLRGDVRALFEAISAWMTDPRMKRILPDLIAECHRDGSLARQLGAELERPRREHGGAVIDRAIARGELKDSIDRELALDLMAAPVFWRGVARRQAVDDKYLDALTEVFVCVVSGLE